MAKRTILAGVADQTIDIFVMDATSTVGAGLSGLVFNAAGLKCYYRKGATGSATQLTLATQTVGGAHSDGGFVEIDATNMKGIYRLDLSDTIVAAIPWATLYLFGATNMVPVVVELEIVSYNPFDGVRLGLTALPNAAAEASGGLPTLSAAQSSNGTIQANVHRWLTGTPNVLQSGRVDVYVGAMPAGIIDTGVISAAELNAMADAILDRNMATGTDSGTNSTAVRTPRQAWRQTRNKVTIVAGVITVYKEDDATVSWTGATGTTAGDPLSSIDPT